MKTSYKILTLALVAGSLNSCADLDTEYLGGYVTSDQKQEVLSMNPEMALAGVTGCFGNFLTSGFASNSNHTDYGYSSMMLMLDCMGNDLASKDMGYNWYITFESYSSCTDSGIQTAYMWKYMYNQIGVVNTQLEALSPEETDPELQFFRAQCLALRAFDYWVLAQVYQLNYSIAPNEPCVPVITEANKEEAAQEGMACSTVKEVYDRIMADIDEAIALLEKCGIDPASVIDSKPKRFFSVAAAYGLRARINLSMHNYQKAAEDAGTAISQFKGAPYSRGQVARPAFASINDDSWMWGIAVSENDPPVLSGICNFPSHMGSFCYGYCTVGSWRWINYNLYTSINNSDVRKGWWIDSKFQSSNLTQTELNYLNSYVTNTSPTPNDGTAALMPYTQVKFATYNNVLNQTINASDIPLMRIEEMYLIQAEATGMTQGVAAGVKLLEDFVIKYRDPYYKFYNNELEAFQDECWRQRRIELWGEGMSYFDIMRLNKGIDRVGGLFPASATYRIEAGDKIFIWCIPLSEIETNRKIDNSINSNRGGSSPTPIV